MVMGAPKLYAGRYEPPNHLTTQPPAMRYRPTFEEFAELARGASLVPVYRQLIGDTLTPVSAFCKIQEGDWAFLFESVVGGERLGRYSFLGSGPFLRFQAYGPHVQVQTQDPRALAPTADEDLARQIVALANELVGRMSSHHQARVAGQIGQVDRSVRQIARRLASAGTKGFLGKMRDISAQS